MGISTETYEDDDDGYSTLRIKANEPGKQKQWKNSDACKIDCCFKCYGLNYSEVCIVELGLNSIKTQCFWCLHICVFLKGTVSTHFP